MKVVFRAAGVQFFCLFSTIDLVQRWFNVARRLLRCIVLIVVVRHNLASSDIQLISIFIELTSPNVRQLVLVSVVQNFSSLLFSYHVHVGVWVASSLLIFLHPVVFDHLYISIIIRLSWRVSRFLFHFV